MKALYNGEIVSKHDTKIDIEDRGYQFGDAIYEIIGVYNGRSFNVGKHINRFQRSARKLNIPFIYDPKALEEKIEIMRISNQLENGMIYLQMSRGVASRTHQFPESTTLPVLVGYTKEAERPIAKQENGVHCILAEDIRWLRCDIKTVNLLGSVLAKEEAARRQCHEAILHRGEVITEGSSTNVFIVKNSVLFTHPANHYILNGITRTVVLELCHQLHIPVLERTFTKDQLLEADEVFITGTYSNILPVTKIEQKKIGDGRPRSLTRILQREFRKLINE